MILEKVGFFSSDLDKWFQELEQLSNKARNFTYSLTEDRIPSSIKNLTILNQTAQGTMTNGEIQLGGIDDRISTINQMVWFFSALLQISAYMRKK